MNLKNPVAEIFVPDGLDADCAIARTTHMAVAAHQDDIEIMAYHGIIESFANDENWFTGVTVTNGSGSPRDGIYARVTDEDMVGMRKREQRKAAVVGDYSAVALLGYTSACAKEPNNEDVRHDLKSLLRLARPRVVYTHNLTDKYDTHVAVGLHTITALRELAPEHIPERVLGCEVWRCLDWMADKNKVALHVDTHANLASALLGVFDSQICGGKRYDTAAIGRRQANATFYTSNDTDATTALTFAMDLTPLVRDPEASIDGFIGEHLSKFVGDVMDRLHRLR